MSTNLPKFSTNNECSHENVPDIESTSLKRDVNHKIIPIHRDIVSPRRFSQIMNKTQNRKERVETTTRRCISKIALH